MKEIVMVDLKTQFSRIEQEVMERIQSVISSTSFIQGTEVTVFENELAATLQVAHCISCANGTDALQISLMALGLKPGDEVLVPAFTYISPVEAIALLQLKPVFVDVDPQTFNMSAERIASSITAKTKAIIVVHLYGQCADMESIMNMALKHNLFVIEDNAQSIQSDCMFTNGDVVKAGCIGDIGTTSFFPSKNLGAYGDGGVLVTNNATLAKSIRSIANHGQEEKYKHVRIGINSRLDTIQAAILNVKLKYLERYIQQRQKAASLYDIKLKGISGVVLPFRSSFSTHVFHQYTIKVQRRDELQAYLKRKGIPAMIYYPIPVHLQEAYAYLGYKKGDFPVTEALCNEVLSLPIHSESEEEEITYICETIKEFF